MSRHHYSASFHSAARKRSGGKHHAMPGDAACGGGGGPQCTPLGPLSACAYDDNGETDAHSEALCAADGTPRDVYHLELRPDAARRDTRLRPYLAPRTTQSPEGITLRVVGSAVAAAWEHVALLGIYAVGMAFLFDHVIEERAPAVFDVPFAAFINAAMFAVGFFLSAKLFGALNKYAEGIRVFFDVADAIGTAWLHVRAQAIRFPLSYCVPMPRYVRPPAECVARGELDARRYVRTVLVQKARIYEELQDIGRALVFALKWQFRTSTASSRFDSSTDADVDLGAPSVDPFKLPMVSYLQNELAQDESDYVTGLLAMFSARVNLLITNGTDGEGDSSRASYQEELTALLVHINAVGTQVSRMSSLQVLGLPTPVTDLLYLALLVVFALQPWALWASLRYYMLIVYALELVFFFSIWGLSQRIGNPFDRFDDSPYIFHDIGELSRGVARNVDDQADKLFAEVLSLNEFYKARGFTGTNGAGTKAVGAAIAHRAPAAAHGTAPAAATWTYEAPATAGAYGVHNSIDEI